MAQAMTPADVSRLLARTAFGATAADLDQWTGKPYADLVESLFQVTALPPLPDDATAAPSAYGLDSDPNAARCWWLERMRSTPFPLLERMTLLWHGHFATGVRYPPTLAEVVRQNQTIRAHALGSFRDLVAALTIDPAMLWWLNGVDNAVPHPNENYARELFELFTLGKRPQVYTERDIREAARVLTGWYLDGGLDAKFAASRHDAKSKRVLGRTIANANETEYLALVDVALAQPVAKTFIAWKLVANLAYVPATNDPLVTKVAKALNGWDIATATKALLLADEFRYADPKKGRQLVRQPVDTMVHAAKALGVRFADNTLLWPLEQMGQSLFNPVNVGGWPLGRDWVSPVTALARYDAGLALHRLATAQPNKTVTPLPEPADLAGWAKRLGLAGFGANTKAAVTSYLRRSGGNDAQAGVLTLLLSSPEWVVV
jgi:uncharacterized protein (DUF1800 family)